MRPSPPLSWSGLTVLRRRGMPSGGPAERHDASPDGCVAVFVGPTSARAAASTASLGASCIALGVIEQTENEQATHLSEEACRYAADHAIEFTFVHAHGDSAQELLRVAVGARADLIVVGRSAKARHHIAGSLGRRLTRSHKAPIVVVVP